MEIVYVIIGSFIGLFIGCCLSAYKLSEKDRIINQLKKEQDEDVKFVIDDNR